MKKIKDWEQARNEHTSFTSFRLREGAVTKVEGLYRDKQVMWDCNGTCYHRRSGRRCKKGDIEI